METDRAWHQHLIEFADPANSEHTAARHLASALGDAPDDGLRATWWHLRKTPAWRLRYRPADPATEYVDELLHRLVHDGDVVAWSRSIYEPETLAFGGPAAMDTAHTLFHHDSRHLLAPTPATALGRRETTVVLFSAMLRAADLDWFEQGDVWAKVMGLRSTAHDLAPERADTLSSALRRLMTASPRSSPALLPEPWLAAFETTGRALAGLARSGELERGLRAVLAHHFIFHANRAGITAADQATLAALAVDTVFHTDQRPDSSGPPAPHR